MVMTLEADYAVRIVEYLTKHPERRDAKTISEETQIPCASPSKNPAGTGGRGPGVLL